MVDFLELLNMAARVARPAHHSFEPIDSMDAKFVDTCLDSLDMLMVGMYMAEIYDIDDAIAKTLNPESVQEMYDQIQVHKKRDPESVQWAKDLIK
jgi:acyl carrier protein